MSDFICPGPLSWCVADARRMLGVLADQQFGRNKTRSNLCIAWCSHPEDRPTDPGVDSITQLAIDRLAELGHRFEAVDLPLQGWDEIFGPLVLAEEKRERGHLLESADLLTDYERKSLQAAENLTEEDVTLARHKLGPYRRRIRDLFNDYDFVVTPTTAATPFPIGIAPTHIAGQRVRRHWGAYPFTAPFNVAGNPAATLPCGFSESLPVGLQVVAPMHADAELLDLAEDMEAVLAYDRQAIITKWTLSAVDDRRVAGEQ